MKTTRKSSLLPAFTALSAFSVVVLAPNLRSEVYSPVVGFVKFTCPAGPTGSDTVVSVPFHKTPRWAGKLEGNPTSEAGGVMRLNLADSPNFAADELTDAPHVLLCRDPSGPNGRHFTITAHAANSVDILASALDLGSLGDDGLVSVIPLWTLSTLFPPGDQTTFHASGGPLASERKSELLFFNNTTEGTNLAPSRRFFVTNSGWFEVGSFTSADAVPLEPGQAFIVRHPAGEAATEFVPNQQVYGGPVSLPVPVAQGVARDTMLALPRPVPVTLQNLDLGPEVFEVSASTDAEDRKDELLVFDNATAQRNKSPSAVYFRIASGWVKNETGFPSSNTEEIEPSAGLLLRKASGGSDATLHWVNTPRYNVSAP